MLRALAPDREREIEMAVDAAVKRQEISLLFWADVRTFGLHEALVYLRAYVAQGLADDRKVQHAALIIDRAIIECSSDPTKELNSIESAIRTADALPFMDNQQPEGNGWDHVDTATPLTEDELRRYGDGFDKE